MYTGITECSTLECNSTCGIYTATFDGGLTEQAELMKEIGKYVDAVVIITNQICRMDEVRPTTKQSISLLTPPPSRVMTCGLPMSRN